MPGLNLAEQKRIAEVARILSEDDVLQRAFDGAIMDAYRELATVQPDNSLAVVRLQAQIEAIAKIRNSLQNLIISAPSERISGLAPVTRN